MTCRPPSSSGRRHVRGAAATVLTVVTGAVRGGASEGAAPEDAAAAG